MLYLIRHGQTEWNKEHRLQGVTDIPLNETGRQMAVDGRAGVEKVHFDVCYTSPLKRAVETAGIMLEGRELPMIPDDRLKEYCFGEYEGSYYYQTDPENPVYVLFHDPAGFVPDRGAESLEEICERTGSFLKEIVYPLILEGKDVLIVAHGGVNIAIYNQVYDIPKERFWEHLMKNCEICGIKNEDLIEYFNK